MNTKLFRNQGDRLLSYLLGLAGINCLAALVLDGGMLFLNRPDKCQAAADAGALAKRFKKPYATRSEEAISIQPFNLPQLENGGSSPASVMLIQVNVVVADVTMNQSSFFARVFIFNSDTLNVPATALCQLLSPGSARNVIPICLNAAAPVGGLGDSDDCTEQHWIETEMQPLINHFMGNRSGVDPW